MFSKKLVSEINEQIKHEMYSAYLYLSMAAHFESENLGGFANWMKKQAKEELEHAMKFFEYINERGAVVILQAIDQPPAEFGNPESVFKHVYEHEQKVTGRIELLYSIAVEDKDYASQSYLNWFIDEQVEEEKNASDILTSLNKIGDSPQALYMLDKALGER